MSDVDVAIIGAGPYGLSLAAHLSAARISYRHLGVPMRLWREAMPAGMFLKSQGFASNLSDPAGTHTLEAFCRATGRPYRSYGLPVSLDTFVSYGQWFQSELDLKVDEVAVTGMVQRGDGFELALADGERFASRTVVVAIGVEHFAYVPAPLSDLPVSAVHAQFGAHRPGGVPRQGSRRRRRRPVGAGVGGLAARERGEGPGPGQKAGHRLERPAAGSGPSPAEAAEGTRGRARLGLVHLVLLRAIRISSGGCHGAPGCTGRARRWAPPGPAGSASGWRDSSPSAPGTP